MIAQPEQKVNFYQMMTEAIEASNIPAPKQSIVLWQEGPARASLVRRSDDNLILQFSIGPRTIISKALAHFGRDYSRAYGGAWKTRIGSEANYGEWVSLAKNAVAAVTS